MNKETLQHRLVEIEAKLAQTLANVNAMIGQKEELLHWIKQLEESSPVAVDEPELQDAPVVESEIKENDSAAA